MTDRSEADRRPETGYGPELTDCPVCGESLTLVTIHGPREAIAKPCNCRIPPDPSLVSR